MKYLIAVILLMASQVQAAPFLVCDPQEGVMEYYIERGERKIVAPAVNTALRYDLAQWPDGVHDIKVRAANMWDVSEPAEFRFTKGSPNMPTNIRIEIKITVEVE